MIKSKIVLSLFIIIFYFLSPSVFAQEANLLVETSIQEETLEGNIIEIIEEEEIEVLDKIQTYQKLKIIVSKGSLTNSEIVVENGNIPLASPQVYKVGDEVLITASKDFEGNDIYFLSGYVRRKPLYLLFFVFVLLTLLVAKTKGLTSILGMGFSIFIILKFILPKILNGNDPVLTAILGSLIIIPVSFVISHGINKKTFVAIGGTTCALIISGFLANYFVNATHLTGFASEEASFLQVSIGSQVDIRGLLLAGILIALLGVLDDITISQSAVVNELVKANRKLRGLKLYKKAMNVGKDHITSMVNTLVLVYVGASLPLMLLFVNNPHPFSEIINYEIIADEIVKTLIGSIGLILAVPITTLIAVWVFSKDA